MLYTWVALFLKMFHQFGAFLDSIVLVANHLWAFLQLMLNDNHSVDPGNLCYQSRFDIHMDVRIYSIALFVC